jgi:GT2 family glycosyltransferase
MKTNVAVVIPNWNGNDFIVDCLGSLMKQSQAATVIVVDNGSSDGSDKLVEKKFPSVTLLKLPSNLGFAGGVNHGIQYALEHDFTHIALFNNDAVAEPDWLEKLVKAMDANPKLGIVTGKFMKMDKQHIDSTGDFCRLNGMPSPRGRGDRDKGQYDTAEYVFGATGGASLYRAKMFQDIGLFDEDFFAYFEDVDISFRAQLAGWKVWYTPEAVAYHHIGGTSSKLGSFSRFHSVKNFIYLYNKNMPGWLFWRYKLPFFWKLTRMKLGSIRDGQFGAYLKGFFTGLGHMPVTLQKRRKIQNSRKVSTAYIYELLKQADQL